MNTSIPTTPMALPPMLTATNTQMDGRPTEPAHDFWVDQVALHLLKDEEQDHEPHRLHGVGHQDHKSAHEAADEGAEDGNEGGDANEDADHQGVRESEQGHGDEEHGT